MSREIITGIFNDSFPPIMDGVAIVTRNYAYWLNRIAGPSCVVTVEVPGYYDQEEFPVYRFPSLPLYARPPYRLGVSITGLVRQKRIRGSNLKEVLQTQLFDVPFDIVHTHSPFSSGFLALRVARMRKIPLVASFHTKYKEDFLRIVENDFFATVAVRQLVNFYNKADLVLVPSEETIETLRNYGYEGPVEVMPNGTDLVVDEQDLPVLREQGAQAFAIPHSVPLILYIGQHIKEKNLDLVIDSLALLKKKGIPFRMLFIGDGYYAPALKQRAAEAGLGDWVVFRGIIRDRALITQAYARADLLFFPSLYDTSSLIIREAAGMRVPSLLVRGSSTAAGVRDGINGFLAENDPSAMAASLELALGNKALRKQAGMGAYRTLYRTWEQVAHEVEARYRLLIEEYASRS